MKMIQTRRIIIMLTFSVAFCFVLVSTVQSEESNLMESEDIISMWSVTQEGTDEPLEWQDHEQNLRFAVYDAETPEKIGEDLVLDN